MLMSLSNREMERRRVVVLTRRQFRTAGNQLENSVEIAFPGRAKHVPDFGRRRHRTAVKSHRQRFSHFDRLDHCVNASVRSPSLWDRVISSVPRNFTPNIELQHLGHNTPADAAVADGDAADRGKNIKLLETNRRLDGQPLTPVGPRGSLAL
jgi:hypothetical protein